VTLTCFYRGVPLWTWDAHHWPPVEVFAGRWGQDWSYLLCATVEEAAQHPEPKALAR
jgi:hypothetical protein